MAATVGRLKQQLPSEIQMVSFGRTHHRFAWHYGQFIPEHPWPHDPQQVSAEVDYFCFERPDSRPRELPFAWEQVAVVSCERNRSDKPHDKVIIGRRLPAAPTAVGTSPSRR